MGFKVMLWVCPFISADSEEFRRLASEGLLLLEGSRQDVYPLEVDHNQAAVIRWWNGASGLLDFSNLKSADWFREQLDFLQDEYGVDGFKFDAGDANFYTGNLISKNQSLPNDHTKYFAQLGLDYPLNEYRVSWKLAGTNLVQRLRDKRHDWDDLKELIPGITTLGLMGYAYSCPDMIGGGEYGSFLNLDSVDQELIVRWAQTSALMPMMQYSVAPWRVLTSENSHYCREMAQLHVRLSEEILDLAVASANSGEPIVRPLSYHWSDDEYAGIKDEFMLGPDILVAPVLEQGQRTRTVIFPPGIWEDENGTSIHGPATLEVDAPLSVLPWFRRVAP